MQKYKVYNLVFSSSATVYGKTQYLPLDEHHPTGLGITNPYGQTKFFIEQIIKDLAATDKVNGYANDWVYMNEHMKCSFNQQSISQFINESSIYSASQSIDQLVDRLIR